MTVPLRELQCPLQGRTPQRGDLLYPEGGTDRHRGLAETLQYRQATQRPWIPAARAREHRPIGPETTNALTMELDQSVGAGHQGTRTNSNPYFALARISRGDLRRRERLGGVHYPVGIQSIDLGLR